MNLRDRVKRILEILGDASTASVRRELARIEKETESRLARILQNQSALLEAGIFTSESLQIIDTHLRVLHEGLDTLREAHRNLPTRSDLDVVIA